MMFDESCSRNNFVAVYSEKSLPANSVIYQSQYFAELMPRLAKTQTYITHQHEIDFCSNFEGELEMQGAIMIANSV